MCLSDDVLMQQGLPSGKKLADSAPPLRAASTLSSTSESVTSNSSSSGNSSDDESHDSRDGRKVARGAVIIDEVDSWDSTEVAEPSYKPSVDDASDVPTISLVATLAWLVAGGLVAMGLFAFSLWFPHALAPHAAKATYHLAVFSYDKETSHFDNTVWTYGTDYGLAVIMASLATYIVWNGRNTVSQSLCWRAASLLLLYCVSVTAGGYSHQYFLTLESRNTLSFRIWWTVCVGTVTAASTAMGMSGSQVLRQYQENLRKREEGCTEHKRTNHNNFGCLKLLQRVPVLPDCFWVAFGMVITGICVMGGMSYQRPACDIFIAGITQSPSTFYVMIFFALVQHKHVENYAKLVGLVGFILNAPLLPMYPLLVQYTDWTLASVNTLLHCWLCVAWCMQGISMHHVAQALILEHEELVKTSLNKKNK